MLLQLTRIWGAVVLLVSCSSGSPLPDGRAGQEALGSELEALAACSPLLCDDAGGVCCGAVCCLEPKVCVDGVCAASACDYTVDGVCCDSPCTSYCAACTAAKKGYGVDGQCGYIAAGLDPEGECSSSAPGGGSCGSTGACDGAGSCQAYNAGETCNDFCNDDTILHLVCVGGGCGSDGAWVTSCAPYRCSGNSCTSSCASNDQCSSSAFCSGGACNPKRQNGGSCAGASECVSGNCVDGVCCNAPCGGVCQSCSAGDTGQTTGTCAPVKSGTDPGNDCSPTPGDPCGFDGQCAQGSCRQAAQGTACGSATCSNGTITGTVCSGVGACVPGTTTSCSPYLSCGGATSCAATCKTDQDCIASHYCRAGDKTCVPDLVDGGACTAASQCASGNCVEGVCCNSKCDGTCQSCRATNKLSGADGVCGNVKVGLDPGNDCEDTGAAACGTDGSCSGAGTCRLYPSGVACGTTKCEGGQVKGSVCNGAGTCNPGSSTSCSPYVKCDGVSCADTCQGDSECVAAHYCRLDDGQCVPDLDAGATCSSGAQCKTGFCADGVCCNSACDSDCQACTAVLKGTGSDGSCGNVRPGTDPHSDCDANTEEPCGYDGECNGQGGCRLRVEGYPCGETSCSGNTVKGTLCTGQGACAEDPIGVLCAPYTCTDEACTSPCTSNAGCLSGYFCADGACITRQPIGEACSGSAECESAFCVDGVCCDGPCSGQCEACDLASSRGVCAGVDGEPHGNRTPCTGGDEACGGTCESENRTACAYSSTTTRCGTSCAAGMETTSLCNGQGACQPSPQARSCSPYACGQDACLEECATDGECVEGFECSVRGSCVPSTETAECSQDLSQSVGVNGTTDCAPYLCDAALGTCRVACSTSTDCAGGDICEASSKTCVLTKTGALSDDSGGCGCRLERSSRQSGSSWLAMSFLLLWLTRRRSRVAAGGPAIRSLRSAHGGFGVAGHSARARSHGRAAPAAGRGQ